MQIFAGGRGSGKTYKLVHLAAKDPEGYFVAPTHAMARWVQGSYKDVIHKSRVITRSSIDDSRYLPMNIYVDEVESGVTIPSHWFNFHNLVAMSMASDTIELHQTNLPLEYRRSLLEYSLALLKEEEKAVERDELALTLANLQRSRYGFGPTTNPSDVAYAEADALMAAGYRKVS